MSERTAKSPSQLSPSLRTTLVSLAIVFVASLTIGLIQGNLPFYYDSGGYWRLSETFSEHGSFSLFDFDNSGLRGYFLPLVYFTVREIAGLITDDASLIAIIFNSALFALVAAVLVPTLARITWPDLDWGIGRRVALGGLLLVFWSGYINYPLSDFPALVAAMVAIIAASFSKSPAWMLAGGLAAGIALNTRPAYLLLTPLLVLLVLWDWRQDRQARLPVTTRRALCLGLFLLGVTAISIPQSLVQHHSFGSFNPIPGGNKLASFQYTAGLELQRYETYVGAEEGLVTPKMQYRDPHTRGILRELEDEEVSGTKQYLEIVAKHPIAMSGVFLRHTLNGLDQRYTTPYVKNLEPPERKLLRFAGFLVVFLALLRICWPAARRSLGPSKWRYPAVLAISAATSIPSAIETRFMLPIFVLCATLVLAPGWPKPYSPTEPGWQRYRALAFALVAAVVYFAVVWTVVSQTSDHLVLAN